MRISVTDSLRVRRARRCIHFEECNDFVSAGQGPGERESRGAYSDPIETGGSLGRIGLPEMPVVFAIALVISGPRKLADLARGLGQAIRGFKEAVAEGGKTDGNR
jgi:TatA/E family protein of Tat protein translocase